MELDGTILENFQVPSSTGLMEMNGMYPSKDKLNRMNILFLQSIV